MSLRLALATALLLAALAPGPARASAGDWSAAVILTEATDVDEATANRVLHATEDACRGTALIVKQNPEELQAALLKQGLSPRSCGADPVCVAQLGKAAGVRYVVAISAASLGSSVAITVDIVDVTWGRSVGHGTRGLSSNKDWSEVMADTVTQALPDPMRRPTGTLVLSANVERAKVAIDGRAKGYTPLQPIPIAPGDHDVVVAKEGYVDFHQKVEVEPGGESNVEVVLKKPVPKQVGPPTSKLRIGAYVAGGATVVALATGIGFAVSQQGAVTRFCARYLEINGEVCSPNNPARADPPELRELRSEVESKSLAANISFAVAGVAAVTTGVLLYLDFTSPPPAVPALQEGEPEPKSAALLTPRVGFGLLPGGASLSLSGRF